MHEQELHPKELKLIKFIRDLEYGTIKELKIQHGLPERAELPLKSVKFEE